MVCQPHLEEAVYEVLRDKGRRPCRPLPRRLRELEDSISGGAAIPEGSLRLAALHFQKDVRTIRRWCAARVFPTARRTVGGHWRIPFHDILKARPPANSRSPKTMLGLRGRKRFLKAPMQLFSAFLAALNALRTAKGPLSREEAQNLLNKMLSALAPVACPGQHLLEQKVGHMWTEAQFQRLEEELRAASWQEAGISAGSASQPTKARGFSLKAFAESAAVHRTTVYRWRKANPWLDELLRAMKLRVRRQTLLAAAADPENLGKDNFYGAKRLSQP